ncbi:MAG: putative tricarboxylic transport membrane protein [Gammaproteobacteria bacterium]
MRVNDAITGLLLVLFSIAIFLYSTTFPKLFGMQFGAGFWPQLLSVLLAICGASLVFGGIRARARGVAWLELDEWWKQSGTLLTVSMVPASILFYIYASDYFGFIICSLIIIFVLAYRFGLTVKKALILSVVTTASMHIVFVEILQVALPWGLLQTIVFSG